MKVGTPILQTHHNKVSNYKFDYYKLINYKNIFIYFRCVYKCIQIS